MKKGGETWLKQRQGFLLEILGVVVCTSRVVKMKEHLPFRKEFSIFCIENRIVVDPVVQLWKKSGYQRLSFLMSSMLDPKGVMICKQRDKKFDWVALPYDLVYPIFVVACGWIG